MFTRFEEHAACSMQGQPDAPPRAQGRLLFHRDWERQLYGLAMAVAKEGHFEWESFRQELISAIAAWEQGGCEGQPRWDYYERYLEALVAVLQQHGVLNADELQRVLPPGR